jgi:hypothetical protein
MEFISYIIGHREPQKDLEQSHDTEEAVFRKGSLAAVCKLYYNEQIQGD